MQKYYFVQDSEGCAAVLAEVPWWAELASRAVESLDVASGHRLCCGGFEWFHKVPLGKPRYIELSDGERMLDNSLGSLVYDGFCRALSLPDNHERNKHRIPVDPALARTLGFGEDD